MKPKYSIGYGITDSGLIAIVMELIDDRYEVVEQIEYSSQQWKKFCFETAVNELEEMFNKKYPNHLSLMEKQPNT